MAMNQKVGESTEKTVQRFMVEIICSKGLSMSSLIRYVNIFDPYPKWFQATRELVIFQRL